jgi:hypothetical protein
VALLVFALVPYLAVVLSDTPPNGTHSVRLSADAQPTTALWPKFSTPKVVFVADAHGLSNDDLATLTTLQGLYNGAQMPTRLYLNYRPEDDFWITQVPKSVQVVNIPPPPAGETLVQDLLRRFGSVVKGAVVTNPSNVDTVNLATTLAGIDQAVVVDPAQVSLIQSLNIPVIYSFDTQQFTNMNNVETYQWGVDNLISQTSTRILWMLPGTHGPDRDYAVAAKAFTFNLTSTNAAQRAMFGTILAHTPANTPIMGYIPNENPDVGYLSAQGHFLNASDNLSNGSVWASMPSPDSVSQPTDPVALKAEPDTVYLAFLVSDGDNAQYMEHRMAQVWQGGDVGAIPEGWTIASGAIEFAPTLLQYFYQNLPANSEFVTGPSGIGYTRQMSGANLDQFATLTNEIMARTDQQTMQNLQDLAYLNQYAADPGVPSMGEVNPLAPTQIGDTTAIGTSTGWIAQPQTLFCDVHQQSENKRHGEPLFIEPMVDAWTLTPTDVLHIAQQLALAAQKSGYKYVFTTPTQLALTMKDYYAGTEGGLPTSNKQSMTGDDVLAKPIIDPAYPTNPVEVTGPNLVTNPSAASGTTGWATSGGSVSATTYQGAPALHWTSSSTGQSWAYTLPSLQKGQTYTFSFDVAGSGQVFLDSYVNGDYATLPINLTSSYQHLTLTETYPAGTTTLPPPGLQVRSNGAGTVSAYVKNASVAQSTPAC